MPRLPLKTATTLVLLSLSIWLPAAPNSLEPSPTRKEQLATAIAQADRIEIFAPYPSTDKTPLATITGPELITEFLATTEFSEDESGGHCMCYGDALLNFMQDDETLATLSYHHSLRLRWNGGPWKGDSELTPASKAALPVWFYEHGFPQFYRSSKRDLARKARYQADLARFNSFFSDEEQEIITLNFSESKPDWFLNASNQDKAIAARLLKQTPDKTQFATNCFLALGTPLHFNELSHNAIWWNVVRAASAVPDADFKRALENVAYDPWGLLGAYEPYRRGAYYKRFNPEDRNEWTLKIAGSVLSLAEDYEKDSALQSVAALQSPQGDAFLLKVARGAIGREIEYQQHGGIRATAYHFLSARGNKDLEPEIRDFLSTTKSPYDTNLLKAALLRIGNIEYLSLELYDSDDDVQATFLEAIVQSKTAEHIDLLVQLFEEELNESSDRYVGEETLIAFEKATGFPIRSSEENAEDTWYPEDEHFQKAITWWKLNRQSFVKNDP